MGKASRRKRQHGGKDHKKKRAPYVGRPFEGLTDEPEWVAMREILPAATAQVRVTVPQSLVGTPDGVDLAAIAGEHQITLVTVLPGAMPAVHRDNGDVLVALQSRTSSGDASRDITQAILTALAVEPGTSINSIRPATAETPRLENLLESGQGLDVEVHQDFEFWLGPEAGEQERALLEQMNAEAVPMEKVERDAGKGAAYWCKMTGRAYIRWILAEDEDAATAAMARLQAAGQHTLGADSELLGAFRADGLLVPVLEVDPGAEASSHARALNELASRYAEALGKTEALTVDERRARDGLISRQVTLR